MKRKRREAEDTPIWKDWETTHVRVKVYITQHVGGKDKLVRRSQKRAVYIAPNGCCYRKDKVDTLWKTRPREEGAHVWLSLVDAWLTMAWQSSKRRGMVRLAPVE